MIYVNGVEYKYSKILKTGGVNVPSLVLEGGTFRPIFSAGVMDALLDNDIMFPYCIGVSAGITNGVSYISRQKGRNLEVLLKYRNDKRYIGKRNFLKYKSLFGLDFGFDKVPNELNPFDWETFNSYEGRTLIGVTNAKTGQEEYFDSKEMDRKCTLLRATCAIPMLFPAITINNTQYYDGGLADPIPVRKAIADGNEKHLIILTRTKDYVKTCSKSNKLVSKILRKKYPKLEKLLLNRHIEYNKTVKFCNELESQGKAIVIRPRKPVESFEKNLDVINENYRMGYEAGLANIDKIKSLF